MGITEYEAKIEEKYLVQSCNKGEGKHNVEEGGHL